MAPSQCCSRARRVPLAVVGSLAFLIVSLLVAAAHAQPSVFGQWQTSTVITTSGYSEQHRIVLTLAPNWRFEQVIQSMVFPARVTYTFGRFSSVGPNIYRFVVNPPQQGQMPAWTARMTLLSSSTMLYEDLSLGGKTQFQRIR